MNYILFDPPDTRGNLLPLTFARPVGEIRIGILRIREKWEKILHSDISHLTQAYLSEKYPLIADSNNILLNGSLLPDQKLLEAIHALKPGQALVGGEILLALSLDRQATESFDPAKEADYEVVDHNQDFMKIEYPWDIFRQNGKALEDDFKLLTQGRESESISGTNTVLGEGGIFLEEGARVECASLNTISGPIYIGKNAEIMEGAMVRGPFALGDHSTLKLGSKIYGPTTIGPHSKVGGEVNNSVIFGYSNKAHDGFLGNSVIAEWCNIGADSNNSNLKNNYTTVKLWNYPKNRFSSSGLTFCGLIMADHSKCGINTMFNTGTVVGVNANIFGSGFLRNFIPSFSWGGAQKLITYQLDKALEVAEEVMKRRDCKLDSAEKEILSEIFRQTEKYRT